MVEDADDLVLGVDQVVDSVGDLPRHLEIGGQRSGLCLMGVHPQQPEAQCLDRTHRRP
jgi:hypothetical protein